MSGPSASPPPKRASPGSCASACPGPATLISLCPRTRLFQTIDIRAGDSPLLSRQTGSSAGATKRWTGAPTQSPRSSPTPFAWEILARSAPSEPPPPLEDGADVSAQQAAPAKRGPEKPKTATRRVRARLGDKQLAERIQRQQGRKNYPNRGSNVPPSLRRLASSSLSSTSAAARSISNWEARDWSTRF